MKTFFLKAVTVISSIIFCVDCTSDQPTDLNIEKNHISLEAGFINPPVHARPSIYYLLLNGYVNKDYIGKELASLKEKGIGGLCVFDMGGREKQRALATSRTSFHERRMAG